MYVFWIGYSSLFSELYNDVFIILNNPKAGDTAFCDSEQTLSPPPEKGQGKRISWKVCTFNLYIV